jgi:hypothetical protein
VPYLNCSHCGLSIRPRLTAIEHCPRCIARSQIAVPMYRSALPARALPDRRANARARPVAPSA